MVSHKDAESDSIQITKNCRFKILIEESLRHVMLKSRFADTILKAQEKMLMLNGGKGNAVDNELILLKKRKACTEAKAKDA